MTEFWMVWCETGNAPKVKHPSEMEAGIEAERLARAHPGQCFFVLSCKQYVTFHPAPVKWVKLDDLPF